MKWISVEDELPEKGNVTRYKAEIWRHGIKDCVETGKAEYLGMNKIIEKPMWNIPTFETDDCYENVTHWAILSN